MSQMTKQTASKHWRK